VIFKNAIEQRHLPLLGIGIYTSIKHNKNKRLYFGLTPSPFAPKGIKERVGVRVIKSSI